VRKHFISALALVAMTAPALAQGEVNIYSSRHYDTDDTLYQRFTEETGITVNRVEDEADVLMERMRSEGDLSPADVFITVDVGRIIRADEAGLLQPIDSSVVEETVPEHLRAADGDWTAITTRARLIFFDRNDVTEPPQTYAELADPKWRGKVCTRSSSNVYMLSLLASIIAHEGEDAAKAWAEGVKANLAREPQGGDTDQLRALVSGECDVAVSNHYYFARAAAGEVEGLTSSLDQIGWVFPNQGDRGTHVNISAVGLAANAPNADNGRRLIEFMLTPEAQAMLATGAMEFPLLDSVEAAPAVEAFGDFKRDAVSLDEFARFSTRAQEIYNEVGYP
jgi:iron(III) transport system substrate-binding protein